MSGFWEDPKASLEVAHNLGRMASEARASLVCFPEQFATGWSPRSTHCVEDLSGTIVTGLKKIALSCGIYVLGSLVERYSPKPRNTCVVINPQGHMIATYAKIHLFSPEGEDEFYSPGDRTSVFSIGGYRLGIALCYDLRFPALFQLYATQGVHGVIVPASWPCSRIENWEVFIKARAMENQIYIIGVNRIGTTPIDSYCGDSMAVDPRGTVISRGKDGEELILTDLNKELLHEVRREFPILKDQRPDLYWKLREHSDWSDRH